MGIKSTETLTRVEAEELYFSLLAKLNKERLGMSDCILEDMLEHMNDRLHTSEYGGQSGFYNYRIKD